MELTLIKTGLNDIDSQHEQLIGCINDLAKSAGTENAKEAVKIALMRLSYYAVSHLAYEEQGMTFFGYPRAAEHIEQHQFFVHKLETITEKIKQGLNTPATDLLIFMREWLLTHIGKEDVLYAEFLVSCNAAPNYKPPV